MWVTGVHVCMQNSEDSIFTYEMESPHYPSYWLDTWFIESALFIENIKNV